MESRKTVVIMQPGYLPWLGFFELLWQSDVFVVYDNVQYDKNGWRNRNRIKTPNGPLWLTVPVRLPNGLKTKISETLVAEDGQWQKKHIGTLIQYYKKAPYFEKYFPDIKNRIETRHGSLLDLDMALIRFLMDAFEMKREIVFASSLGIDEEDKVHRLIKIVKLLGGNRFYEPAGGKAYLENHEISRFRGAGIKFDFQDYRHPAYRQLHGEFAPNLSAIDLLFNEGPESPAILTRHQRKEG